MKDALRRTENLVDNLTAENYRLKNLILRLPVDIPEELFEPECSERIEDQWLLDIWVKFPNVPFKWRKLRI